MPPVLFFTVRYAERLREWIIEPNAIFPFPLRFLDETSPVIGAPGLIGALAHCNQVAEAIERLQEYRTTLITGKIDVRHNVTTITP